MGDTTRGRLKCARCAERDAENVRLRACLRSLVGAWHFLASVGEDPRESETWRKVLADARDTLADPAGAGGREGTMTPGGRATEAVVRAAQRRADAALLRAETKHWHDSTGMGTWKNAANCVDRIAAAIEAQGDD
jgi:hypothetical protein